MISLNKLITYYLIAKGSKLPASKLKIKCTPSNFLIRNNSGDSKELPNQNDQNQSNILVSSSLTTYLINFDDKVYPVLYLYLYLP